MSTASNLLDEQGCSSSPKTPFRDFEFFNEFDVLSLVHNAHRIEMRGDSIRKKRGPQPSS